MGQEILCVVTYRRMDSPLWVCYSLPYRWKLRIQYWNQQGPSTVSCYVDSGARLLVGVLGCSLLYSPAAARRPHTNFAHICFPKLLCRSQPDFLVRIGRRGWSQRRISEQAPPWWVSCDQHSLSVEVSLRSRENCRTYTEISQPRGLSVRWNGEVMSVWSLLIL